ncbi:hypothetical protein U2F26_23905 [Micromonospora sp. 4G57]|uniref:Uncharacterized protein n=1 Tax=Micromonospora sicca TaxID=2202420 RepID=A0ABU5JGC3_9ACTN|nr:MULTISPECIES: hypothetical protein [unclassified Micromonospora]MDZ5445738.1 hypothetical protein [Micromonospora sp. 4G57]MDZ5491660.1 hypothetical protein [Micromonospora sp. 4G53]
MALGDRVLYTFDETQAHYVRMRNTNGGLAFPIPETRAGDTHPADVVHDYGDGVVDLMVLLRGPGRHFVMNAAQGTAAGQPGRWAVKA